MRTRSRVLMVVVAATTFAACGSNDDATSGTSNAATTETVTTDAPDTATPTSAATTEAAPTTDASTTEVPVSTDAPVTDPPTTQPPATRPPATEAPTTTAGEPVTEGLDPRCAERAAEGDPYELETAAEPLAELGPLGPAANLQIELPAARDPEYPDAEAPIAMVERVAGGVVLGVRGTFGVGDSMLAAVDVDGQVRWVRCLAGTITRVVAPVPVPGNDQVLVATFAGDSSNLANVRWTWFSTLDGSEQGTLDNLFSERDMWPYPVAESDAEVWFGPDESIVVDETSVLVRVGLTDDAVEQFPLPEIAFGQEAFQLRLEVAQSGDLVLVDNAGEAPGVVAALVDGEWTSDQEVLAETYDVRAGFTYANDSPALAGYDALGNIVWNNASVIPFNGEGFVSGPSADVTVVAGCFGSVDESLFCEGHQVGGVDTATGDVLWQLPGDRGVGPLGDGYALVTVPETETWVMIDTSTGDPIEGQEWDDADFGTSCCGDGDYFWTVTDGGVVIATQGRVVNVWYPATTGLGSSVATLP